MSWVTKGEAAKEIGVGRQTLAAMLAAEATTPTPSDRVPLSICFDTHGTGTTVKAELAMLRLWASTMGSRAAFEAFFAQRAAQALDEDAA